MNKKQIIDGIEISKYGIIEIGFFHNGQPNGWTIDGKSLIRENEASIHIKDNLVFIGPFLSPTLTTEYRESIQNKHS